MGFERNRDAIETSLEEMARESDREGKADEDEAKRLHGEAEHKFQKSRIYRKAARLIGNLGPERRKGGGRKRG